MVFQKEVSMFQIFNADGELKMMFPVDSAKVNLGLSLFKEGSYRMGFIIEGIDEVQFTNLIVK